MSGLLAALRFRLQRVVSILKVSFVDDTGVQQRMQVLASDGAPEGIAEVIDDVPRLGDYGFAYRPPDGSEAIVLFIGGSRSAGVVVATGHRASRPRDLEPGEAMLYNGLTGAFVRMCADGKTRSRGDWEHEGDFIATGDIRDHSASNDVTMKAHRDAYNAHDHGGVQAGAARTNGPVPQAE